MSCNCGGASSSDGSSSSLQLNPPPDASKGKAPDGTPIGQDASKGGTVPAYGTPGGAGTASSSSGGGYTGATTEHATGANANVAAPNGSVDPSISALSKKYESRGDYGIVSTDPKDPGGPSYGAYQIATAPGSMNNFLNQLQKTDPDAYKALQDAGGDTAARAGDPTFINAWKDQAANNPNFAADQDKFIQSSYYDPAAAKVLASTGVDVNTLPLGVQQSLYSYAVQSPVGAVNAYKQALQGQDPSNVSANDVTNTIYDQRVADVQNGGLSADRKASVIARLGNERQDALAANSTTPTKLAAASTANVQTGV
jgi:hypothetical protein